MRYHLNELLKTGINARGQIVGQSDDGESNPHAVLWTRKAPKSANE
jgi:probable HAF family extracellular repeat protein